MLERESLATETIEGVADPRDEKPKGMIMRGNGSSRVKNKMTERSSKESRSKGTKGSS